MLHFFKDWRRTIGCVTLAMACVFAIGWLRSFSVTDIFLYVVPAPGFSDTDESIIEGQGNLEFAIRSLPDGLSVGRAYNPFSKGFKSGWFSHVIDENVLRLSKERSERRNDLHEREWR